MEGFGQLIQGKVLDQETREPIDFASVYFDGTFVGTTTDSRGDSPVRSGSCINT